MNTMLVFYSRELLNLKRSSCLWLLRDNNSGYRFTTIKNSKCNGVEYYAVAIDKDQSIEDYVLICLITVT